MDRVRIQLMFRKIIFTCPKCGKEDIRDMKMEGGNSFENNCSECGQWNNNFKNYDGCISYTQDEYDKLTDEDLVVKKDELVNKFIYDQKNPPPYVEPSVTDYQQMIDSRLEEINRYAQEVSAKFGKADLEVIKSKIDMSVSSVQTNIDSKAELIEDIK